MWWLMQSSLEPDPSAWDGMMENFFSPAMALKLGFIALTTPVWWPIAKVVFAELRASIQDDSDEFAPSHLSPQAPPTREGNPWVSIPYAIYRKHGLAGAEREAGRQARGNEGLPQATAAPRGRGSRGRF